jgi:hypothetical protein
VRYTHGGRGSLKYCRSPSGAEAVLGGELGSGLIELLYRPLGSAFGLRIRVNTREIMVVVKQAAR